MAKKRKREFDKAKLEAEYKEMAADKEREAEAGGSTDWRRCG
jgi:hypothetical protein